MIRLQLGLLQQPLLVRCAFIGAALGLVGATEMLVVTGSPVKAVIAFALAVVVFVVLALLFPHAGRSASGSPSTAATAPAPPPAVASDPARSIRRAQLAVLAGGSLTAVQLFASDNPGEAIPSAVLLLFGLCWWWSARRANRAAG